MKKSILLLFVAAIVLSSASGHAQGPHWTNDTGVSNVTDLYTGNGRPGVTSASFNNQVWVAYTSSNCSSGCAIKLTYSSAPYSASAGNLYFSTPAYVYVPGQGNITSYNSPALIAQNGYLYLAYNDASNTNWLTTSSDGVNWSSPYQLSGQYPTTWAPSLAADALNSGRIYAGFASSSTYTPVICAIYPNPSNMALTTQACYNFTSLNQMNYNPGMVYSPNINSGVMMGYEWRGNQHCLYGYILDPEAQYSYDYNAWQNCGDQTSVAPSMTIYEGSPYLAFGGNNNNRQFNIRFSEDGSDSLGYKQTLNQGMNGSPDLITAAQTYYSPVLINFYAWNGQMRYMEGQ